VEFDWHGLCSTRVVLGLRPAAAILLLLVAGAPAESATPRRSAASRGTEVEIVNVDLHVTTDITLHVHSLRGRFRPTRPGGVPSLDDTTSYAVEVDAGEVALDEASLNALLNEHVFVGHDAPVKDLQVTIEDGMVKQKGKLDKAIDIPFKTKGTVDVTPDGKIRVHARSIKGFGLPVKGLLKALGIEMDDVIKTEGMHGVTVDENDFIIDPGQALPPPRLVGKITSVRIEGDQIVQTFGSGKIVPLTPRAASANHIYWHGGSLRFGKLTMRDTDLELIDQDPKDPFDFSVARYNDMLVAGYSKNLARLGLRTYLPDFNDLKGRLPPPGRGE
jgi:hypothetical protein